MPVIRCILYEFLSFCPVPFFAPTPTWVWVSDEYCFPLWWPFSVIGISQWLGQPSQGLWLNLSSEEPLPCLPYCLQQPWCEQNNNDDIWTVATVSYRVAVIQIQVLSDIKYNILFWCSSVPISTHVLRSYGWIYIIVTKLTTSHCLVCCSLSVGQLNECHKLLSEEDLEFHPQARKRNHKKKGKCNVLNEWSGKYLSNWMEDNFNLIQTQACLINLLL